MNRTLPLFGAIAGAFVLLAACGGDDGDRRVIEIIQNDDLCTPESVDLVAGEKVKFEVKNEGSKDKEIEGIEGTKLEEILVPSGKTRSLNYTAPKEAGTQKVKCYIPGGANNIISLNIQ
jgi:uncharacterized cupredoxin-like copper-binding protein